MAKPATLDGYHDRHTVDCERVLVTLLRGLGPWKESVFLVGGLTPRYLVTARPPSVPAHAGTLDVDIVIDLQILADTAGYHTLEENLRAMRFERSMNDRGRKLSWRWQTRTENGALMVVELLADAPEVAGGRVEPLPTQGNLSALNIPHSSIVFELHEVTEIQAELLGGAGTAVEAVKHANLVSFTCLKAFAFDQRFERKDAHDLVYCIEHAEEGLDGAAQKFREALKCRHGAVIRDGLSVPGGRRHASKPRCCTCLNAISRSRSCSVSQASPGTSREMRHGPSCTICSRPSCARTPYPLGFGPRPDPEPGRAAGRAGNQGARDGPPRH